jgi:TIR domain
MMQDRIFLSHKGANKPMVRQYYGALKAAGFRPWFDEVDIPAGTNPDRGIRQGFKGSCAVVFFITSEFKDEAFLRDEINYAKEEERDKGDRFAIISVILADSGKSGKPTVPDLLRQYIWIEEDNHFASLSRILDALPIRLGGSRWKMEPDPDELDANLRLVNGKIHKPVDGQMVPTRQCAVSGTVEGYNQQPLYLFTGGPDRFWPSARIKPDPEGNWSGEVHLGSTLPTGTIRLAAVDPNVAQYIEVYRTQAGHMNHSGMVIPRFKVLLATIRVKVDISKT